MTDTPTAVTTRRDNRSRRRRPRRRVSVIGVIGELLITVGVVALLYVAWQMWIGDLIFEQERFSEASEISQQWQEEYEAQQDGASTPTPDPTEEPAVIEPVVRPEAADAEIFGNMYVPRWGAEYKVPIAGGVTRARTLDPIGIGHYPGTPMPGDVGNVALAAHRTTFGKPFNRMADLRLGDAVVIETQDGWYTYRFRTLEYVQPDETEVLLPVPQNEMLEPNGRYLTLTSCSPMYSLAERIVGYNVFESFTPRSDGPPASLTEAVV